MAHDAGVAVEIPAQRVGGPYVARRDAGHVVARDGRGEIVVSCIVSDRGHAAGEVHPAGMYGHTSGEEDRRAVVVESNRGALEVKDQLEQGERETSA